MQVTGAGRAEGSPPRRTTESSERALECLLIQLGSISSSGQPTTADTAHHAQAIAAAPEASQGTGGTPMDPETIWQAMLSVMA